MRPLVMGILNVTPDSFSDGGEFNAADAALARAREMIAEGADILDVGGESTRPGANPVPIDQELARVIPAIEAVKHLGRVSIDTRNEATARAAVDAGASLVNDVSATLGPIAGELGVGYVAMHMQGDPRTMQHEPHYDDVVGEVADFLYDRADAAADAGSPEVWIDPGFGFGKTEDHNLELLVRLEELTAGPFPVMVGLSRKRWLGSMLNRSDQAVSGHPLDPVGPKDRLEGSVATATHAMALGARMIRVHDVKAGWQAATVVAGTTEPHETKVLGGR
ncbi:MAG: dihydropteroate synthase [Acidimicrobiia bacterium]|nr:dihydropteroate synthase [Acidimicrobiia bacterium]